MEVGVLGFGCGAVGGLMVKGTSADQERAVARAVELGINYFDSAPVYGDGRSERNLGRVLKALRPDVIGASLDASRGRLGAERVDLFQLHNRITRDGRDNTLTPSAVIGDVVPALERLREQGKIRFFGITAVGDTDAVHEVLGARAFHSAQVAYNLLNPSAGHAVPKRFPGHDFGKLLDRARDAGVGGIGIRVLAGGALSGDETRHPTGTAVVDPIASGPDDATDVRRARRIEALVKDGHASSAVEAALRFAITHPAMSTVLVGYSTLEQLDYAATSVEKGPLPPAALDRLATLWREFASEAA